VIWRSQRIGSRTLLDSGNTCEHRIRASRDRQVFSVSCGKTKTDNSLPFT